MTYLRPDPIYSAEITDIRLAGRTGAQMWTEAHWARQEAGLKEMVSSCAVEEMARWLERAEAAKVPPAKQVECRRRATHQGVSARHRLCRWSARLPGICEWGEAGERCRMASRRGKRCMAGSAAG